MISSWSSIVWIIFDERDSSVQLFWNFSWFWYELLRSLNLSLIVSIILLLLTSCVFFNSSIWVFSSSTLFLSDTKFGSSESGFSPLAVGWIFSGLFDSESNLFRENLLSSNQSAGKTTRFFTPLAFLKVTEQDWTTISPSYSSGHSWTDLLEKSILTIFFFFFCFCF